MSLNELTQILDFPKIQPNSNREKNLNQPNLYSLGWVAWFSQILESYERS